MKCKLFVIVTLFGLGVNTHAADKNAPQKPREAQQQESQNMRQQMAQAHEEMALCLKSDKNMNECRQEMQESCSTGQGCMMMQRRQVRGHMKGHGQMMKQDSGGETGNKSE